MNIKCPNCGAAVVGLVLGLVVIAAEEVRRRRNG
jgi:hypothetical protein